MHAKLNNYTCSSHFNDVVSKTRKKEKVLGKGHIKAKDKFECVDRKFLFKIILPISSNIITKSCGFRKV